MSSLQPSPYGSRSASPVISNPSEGIIRGEIAAAQAEVDVLKVQVKNLKEELQAKEVENRLLRDGETEEVHRLRGIIDERLGGRMQHARYLDETSAKLHDALQEKEQRLNVLNAQVLQFEQAAASAELEAQELRSQLTLSAHQVSSAEATNSALRRSLAAASNASNASTVQARKDLLQHTTAVTRVARGVAACEKSLLGALLPVHDKQSLQSGPSVPLDPLASFSWADSDASLITVGVKGGGGISSKRRSVIYITARDGNLDPLQLPDLADITCDTEAELEPRQLLLAGYGGLEFLSVSRITPDTWRADVHFVQPQPQITLQMDEPVASQSILKSESPSSRPSVSPIPPLVQHNRVGLRLVTKGGLCLATKTFLISDEDDIHQYHSTQDTQCNLLRNGDLFLSPDPLFRTGGGVYMKAILTLRDYGGRCKQPTDSELSIMKNALCEVIGNSESQTILGRPKLVEIGCGFLIACSLKEVPFSIYQVRVALDRCVLSADAVAKSSSAEDDDETRASRTAALAADAVQRARFIDRCTRVHCRALAIKSIEERLQETTEDAQELVATLCNTPALRHFITGEKTAATAPSLEKIVIYKDEAEKLRSDVATLQRQLELSEQQRSRLTSDLRRAESAVSEERLKREEIEQRLGSASESEKTLKRSVDECSKQLVLVTETSRDAVEANKREIKALKKTLKRVEENYEAALSELEEATKREADAEQKLMQQAEALQQLQRLCSQTEKRFSECVSQHDAAATELHNTFSKREAALRAEVASLEEAKQAACKEVDGLKARFNEVCGSLDATSAKAEAADKHLASVEAAAADLRRERTSAEHRVREAFDAKDRSEMELQDTRQKLTAAEDRIQLLQKELQDALDEADHISAEWERNRGAADALQRGLQLREGETRNLTDALQGAEDKLRDTQQLNTELHTELALLRERCDEQTNRLDSYREEVSLLRADIAQRDDELAALHLEMTALKKKYDLLALSEKTAREDFHNAKASADKYAAALASTEQLLSANEQKADRAMESLAFDLEQAKADTLGERERRLAVERDVDLLLRQVDCARTALVGSPDDASYSDYSYGTLPACDNMPLRTLVTQHNAGMRLLQTEQDLCFSRLSHLAESSRAALMRNMLLSQAAEQSDKISQLTRELKESQIELDSKQKELVLIREQLSVIRDASARRIDAEGEAKKIADVKIEALDAELDRERSERIRLEEIRRDLDAQVTELRNLLNEEIRLRVKLQDSCGQNQSRDTEDFIVSGPVDEQIRQLQRMVTTLKSERRLDAQQYARLKQQLDDERTNASLAEAKMRSAKELVSNWEATVQSQHNASVASLQRETYQSEARRQEAEHKLVVAEKRIEALNVELKIQKQRATSSEHALREANHSLESLRLERLRSPTPSTRRRTASRGTRSLTANGYPEGSTGRSVSRSASRNPSTPTHTAAKSPSIATHYVNIS